MDPYNKQKDIVYFYFAISHWQARVRLLTSHGFRRRPLSLY